VEETEAEPKVQASAPILKATTPAVAGTPLLITKPSPSSPASPQISTKPLIQTPAPGISSPAKLPEITEETSEEKPAQAMAVTKPKSSNAPKVILGIGLGLVAVILVIVLLSRMSGNKDTERYNELVALAAKTSTTEVPIDSEDLEILLGAAATVASNNDRNATYQALYLSKATDGTDIDKRIVDFATKTEVMLPDVRTKLLGEVLKLRKNPEIVAPLLSYARKSDDPKAAVAAIEATRSIATQDNFGTFIEIIKSNSNDLVRKAAEANAAALISQTTNKIPFERILLPTYEAAFDDTTRHAILRLLGYTGGKKALEINKQNLESSEDKNKIAALVALGNWGDDKGYGQLIDFIASGPDMQLRNRAFDSAMKYANGSEDNLEDVWSQLAGQSKTQEEQLKLIRGLANVPPAPWVFSLLDDVVKSADSERVSDLATRAIGRLKEIEKTRPKKKGK
ncbi:MAG: hypothetical protein ACSHX7_07585, partial [Luteolibacter sp.]